MAEETLAPESPSGLSQIQRVVDPQVEGVGRNVARGTRRAAASRRRPVVVHHLKQVRRRPKQVVAGVCALILGGSALCCCNVRPQRQDGEQATSAKCADKQDGSVASLPSGEKLRLQGRCRASGRNWWWLVVHLVRRSPLLNRPSIQARPAPALIRRRCRRHARQDDPYLRSLAGFAVELEPATQTTRDDVVDDVQTEAGAALVATRREERVERLTLDTETHATAIVGGWPEPA